MFIRTCKKNST